MKIKDNLDLQGYLLQNFCVDNYDSLDSISNKGDGRMVFLTGNSTDAKYRHVNVWDGTNFKALAYLEDVAMNDDFIALQEKVALLAGDVDTDAIISNMKEVSAFLEGFAEDASLMDYLTSELGKKLDKAGGTVSGPLTIKFKGTTLTIVNEDGMTPYIGFRSYINGVNTDLGDFGVNTSKNLVFYKDGAWRNVIHSGNVGEYALKKVKDVTSLDTVNAGEFFFCGYKATNVPETNYAGGVTFQTFLDSGGNDYRTQLAFTTEAKGFVRGYANGTWSNWKTIAFTDSNVAGAQALVHSNGTVGATVDANGNVSFNGAGVIQIDGNEVIGKHSSFYIGYQTAVKDGLATRIWGKGFQFSNEAGAHRMIINESGNVTIGASDAVGTNAKLYVDGNTRIGGSILLNRTSDNADAFRICNISNTNDLEISTLGGNGAIVFKTNTSGSETEKMRIAGNGNVLIGATEDNGSGAKLQVAGYVHATNATITQHIYAKAFRTEGENGIWKGNTFTSSLTATDLVIKGDTVKLIGNLQATGRIEAGGSIITRDRLEVFGSQPYIDFHHNNTTDDYSIRLIEQTRGTLELIGNLRVTGNIIADGEVSAGGAGEEGENESGGGREPWASDPFAITSTTMEFSHNLGTDNVIVQVYEQDATSGHWSMILVDVEIIDNANIALHFGRTESTIHKVIVMG